MAGSSFQLNDFTRYHRLRINSYQFMFELSLMQNCPGKSYDFY